MTTSRELRLEHFARAGFAARGVVYCLVGGLALMAAIGSGGDVGGGKSALRSLIGQPFGSLLLGGVGLGLVFFAAWRVIEGVADADGHGTSAKGLGTRALHVLSGLVNAGLALTAFNLALGSGSGGGDDQAAQDWTQWVLAQPFGQWLVGAIGAGFIAAGLAQGWKGWRGDVMRRLAPPPQQRDLVKTLGRLGYAARGVTFAIIGAFLILAALHSDSDEAKGLGGALQTLELQPYGWLPLGAVSLGLFAFGLFGFVQARWRRIRVPDFDDAKAQLAAQVAHKL
jgi:hypothetical protein